jgi:aldehyde oxidoreductase
VWNNKEREDNDMIKKTLNVNGVEKVVIANPEVTLANVLRENLFLTGTKVGCGKGECGACSVIMNGRVIRSCITKMKQVPEFAVITTVEGVGTPQSLHAVQMAWIVYNGAQCGFCTPGFIVSAKALLDENPKPTRKEVRDWFKKHHNACRCTGYKPLVDATMEAAKVLRGEISMDDLAFKIPSDGKIWGTNYPRPTAVGRVTGTIDFGADLGLKLPNALHLAIAQAKVSHANILSIDTSEAEKMPGVYKVLTHKDVKGNNRIFGLINMPTNKGDGLDRPILCDKKIFQYGDAYAIVCADTEANARAAADTVKIDLEELPAYMNAHAAMAPDAMEIHPGTPNVFFSIKNIKGEDTKPLMAKAPYTVEDEFYTQRQPHLVIEPDVGVAYMNEGGVLFIYSKSTCLHLHYAMIQPGIGIAPDKLVLASPPAVGAMFGYKLSPTMEALLGVACMATGRPVTLRYDWYQQQTYTGKRSPFFTKLKMAADKDGKLLAMESDWTVDHGPYAEFGDAVAVRGAQFIGAGYNIPSIRGEGRVTYTNHSWGCAFRAFGSPQSEFASEVLMDELAEKIGVDPLELRYKNVYREGDTTPSGQKPDVIALPGLIDMARPFYKEALERAKKESTPKKKRGVGVSIGVYGCGLDGPDSSEAWAELTPEGVTIFDCWQDPGQGGDVGTLITAHESLRPLNIAPDKIRLVMNDMSLAPMAGPSAGSRQQVITGQAIKAACEGLIKAMKKQNGTYRTYEEMVAEKLPTRYVGQYTTPGTPCDLETGQGDPFSVYQYCLFLAEVEVDTETGKTSMVKMSSFADVGKICSKLAVDGQFYSGLAQGIGLALSEDFEDIKKHSTMTGAGFPFIDDIPDALEVHFQETPRPLGTFGAAGCGEAPLTSPHASIINAIYNACGVRITKLPAYPEKVLAGLKQAKK